MRTIICRHIIIKSIMTTASTTTNTTSSTKIDIVCGRAAVPPAPQFAGDLELQFVAANQHHEPSLDGSIQEDGLECHVGRHR